MRPVLLLHVLLMLTAANPCLSTVLVKEGVASILRLVGGVSSDTRSRGDGAAAGHKTIEGVADRSWHEGHLGRETGREERGGRHLRAGQGEGGGVGLGYLSLSEHCFTAEDCAPGLFTVSQEIERIPSP